MKKIIILEEDHAQRDYLRSVVSTESDLTFCFDRVASCFDNLTQLNPDLIVVGSFPRKSILRFINAHKATKCNLPSLLMTQDIEIKRYLELNALSIIKTYDSKLNLKTFKNTISNTIKANNKKACNDDFPFIVGHSPCIVKIKEILPDLSHSRENILIEGESGTGKEFVVRAIHCLSGSKDLFVKISAKEVPSGATITDFIEIFQKRIQEKARGKKSQETSESTATIFIDELGYLPDSIQSELLLLIDQGIDPSQYRRSETPKTIRFISTTRVDSDYLLSENRLRKDLFYRLNVINLNIEPLRQHKEDISLLVDYFSYRYCKIFGRSYFELPREIIDIFMDYQWPGNTKELESVVKRAVMNGDAGKFLKDMYLMRNETLSKTQLMMNEGLGATNYMVDTKDFLKQVEKSSLKEISSNFMGKVEKKVMQKALEATNWNRKKAAVMLNISYKSMLNKIKEYGLA